MKLIYVSILRQILVLLAMIILTSMVKACTGFPHSLGDAFIIGLLLCWPIIWADQKFFSKLARYIYEQFK